MLLQRESLRVFHFHFQIFHKSLFTMSHDEFRGECDLHAALSLPFVDGALALGATIKFNCLNGKVGHKIGAHTEE